MRGVVSLSRATHIARGVKGEVEPTICELDEVILNAFAFGQLARVDKISRAKLACPRFLCWIDVDGDHTRCPDEGRRVDRTEANAAAPKDGNCGTLCATKEGNMSPFIS
jgi:hypothetical protein